VRVSKEFLMRHLGRATLFVACLWFSIVPYAHVLEFLTAHHPALHDRGGKVAWMFFECMLPSVLIAACFAFPLAWVFGRASPWIAWVLTVPFAALRFSLIRPDARWLELALAWSTIATYVILVTGATWFAHRWLVRRRGEVASAR
jgi:hypothetical protein